MSTTQRTKLGPDSLLEKTPVGLTVDGTRYILTTRTDGTHVAYTAVCPHQSGRVMVEDETTLICPNHQWEFDAETGACITMPDECLPVSPVQRENGSLYVLESDF